MFILLNLLNLFLLYIIVLFIIGGKQAERAFRITETIKTEEMKQYAISPKDLFCSEGMTIKAGKEYPISGYSSTGVGAFFILKENKEEQRGIDLFCLVEGCDHLDGDNWKIVEK